jgi:peroxiredoxin Q/BCP
VVILGASFDSQEANAKFAKKFDFNFPLLCDTNRELGMAYGPATRRTPSPPSASAI